jgi:Skp family chaperone for outer membrane proteins
VKPVAIIVAALILLLATAQAITPENLDRILQDHEKRIATQEEKSRTNEQKVTELDNWFDSRITALEKYFNGKIATLARELSAQARADTEIQSLLNFIKAAAAILLSTLSIIIGYIGIRNAIRKKN